ncbi:hypothetical protein [Stutzerimonas xanthomarina]|uniref:hypothetical protein n=1 Tax=Stutzerimonas xanthomarina TaxID=271420 RepID=UPI003AA8EE64
MSDQIDQQEQLAAPVRTGQQQHWRHAITQLGAGDPVNSTAGMNSLGDTGRPAALRCWSLPPAEQIAERDQTEDRQIANTTTMRPF